MWPGDPLVLPDRPEGAQKGGHGLRTQVQTPSPDVLNPRSAKHSLQVQLPPGAQPVVSGHSLPPESRFLFLLTLGLGGLCCGHSWDSEPWIQGIPGDGQGWRPSLWAMSVPSIEGQTGPHT